MRIVPTFQPHLRKADPDIPPVADGKKRHGLVPKQTKFSVQNIPDVTTPQGTAMVNEEFRRLRDVVAGLETKTTEQSPDASSGTGGKLVPKSSTNPGTSVLSWAETIKHNNVVVESEEDAKIVQCINFLDTSDIAFYLNKNMLEAQYQSNSEMGYIQIDIKAKTNWRLLTGYIAINRLPKDPQFRTDFSVAKDYIYEGYNYTPSNGKYGWCVYNLINHNLNLDNKNSYILNLVDIHDIDDTGLTDQNEDNVITELDKQIWHALHFEKQRFEPMPEGLDTNNIIIRGIYKPDLAEYRGGALPEQDLYFIDEGNRIVRTNIIYRYTLLGRV